MFLLPVHNDAWRLEEKLLADGYSRADDNADWRHLERFTYAVYPDGVYRSQLWIMARRTGGDVQAFKFSRRGESLIDHSVRLS